MAKIPHRDRGVVPAISKIKIQRVPQHIGMRTAFEQNVASLLIDQTIPNSEKAVTKALETVTITVNDVDIAKFSRTGIIHKGRPNTFTARSKKGGKVDDSLHPDRIASYATSVLMDGAPRLPESTEEKILSALEAAIPELIVLADVRRLRELRGRSIKEKPKYPGREKQPDAIAFLRATYVDELAAGTLGPGQLQGKDSALYHAIRTDLSRAKDGPRTVADLIAGEARTEGEGSLYQQRVKAAARILGTDERTAARFFGGLRPDRVASSHER